MSVKSGMQRYPLEFLLVLVTLLIISINICLVILTLFGNYYSYAIVGKQNLRVEISIMLVAIILASGISCLATLCSFVIRNSLFLQNRCALTIPALIVHLLLIPIWGILLLSPMSDLETKLMISLTKGYQKETSWDAWSVAWNVIQTTYGRCGVYSPNDWLHSDWSLTAGDGLVPVFCCGQDASNDLVTKIVEHQLTDEDIANLRTKCSISTTLSGDIETATTPTIETLAMITTTKTDLSTINSDVLSSLSPSSTTPIRRKTSTASSTNEPLTTSAPPVRITRFRDPQVGGIDTSNLPYSSMMSWSDPFKEVDARFYFPSTDRPMNWLDAVEYCEYYTQMMEPYRDFTKTPAGLAVGFTSDEIDILSSTLTFQKASKPHLGIYRPTDSKNKDMAVFAYPHIKVREKSSFDNWDDGQPQMSDQLYGCLNTLNGLRHTCPKGKRQFICVKYFDQTSDSLPELEFIHQVRYQKILNGTLLADYRVVQDSLPFEDAQERCLNNFQPSYDLAVGFNQIELDFLAEIATLSALKSKYIHLGFQRTSQEKVFRANTTFKSKYIQLGFRGTSQVKVLRANDYDKVLAPLWVPKEPSNKKGENFGCFDMKYRGRCDEGDHKDRFICAIYESFPENPFPPVTKNRKWLPSSHKAELGNGKTKEVLVEDSEYFSKIFDWKDSFETVVARYYQPIDTSLMSWFEAEEFCRSNVPKADPSRLDYSKHPPIIAVGFTTEELEMLDRLDYMKHSGISPHLGFARDINSSSGKPLSEFVKTSAYDIVLTERGFQNVEKRQAMYIGDWALTEPSFDSGDNFGCMYTYQKSRRDCDKDSSTFICANYLYSDEPFVRKNESELKNVPMVMYQRYVNDFLFAEYRLVDKKIEFKEARKHCGETYGPEFDLAVGFDSEELEFIADIATEGKLSTYRIHLGFNRMEGGFFQSVVFDRHFRTMWSKNEPNDDTDASKEYFGCLKSQDKLGRAVCEAKKRPFVCAVYEKTNFGITLDLKDSSNANEAAGFQSSNQLSDVEDGYRSVSQEGCLEVVKNEIFAFSITLTVLFLLNFLFLFLIFLLSHLIRKLSK